MRITSFFKNKNVMVVAYKLAHDLLFMLLLTLGAALLSQAVIPGILSSHISFEKLAIALLLLIAAITWLGKKLDFAYPATRLHRNKAIPLFLIFAFVLIGDSMLKFPMWQNLIITIVMLIIFLLFYQIIFSPEKEDE
jgi:hypothetical protein